MPGRWSHLALRFVDVVTSRPLDAVERAGVRRWLASPSEEAGFFAQSDADQRHGYASALSATAATPGRPEVVRAALLHDIGKRHAHLGPIARSAASIAIRLSLPLAPRWELYRDHGNLSAAELSGAEPLVVEFARHHHGDRPDSISPEDWAVLIEADAARVGR
ncbi:MAG: hypothetical protein ACRDVD_06440 [Acidimicrobiia bacterium]